MIETSDLVQPELVMLGESAPLNRAARYETVPYQPEVVDVSADQNISPVSTSLEENEVPIIADEDLNKPNYEIRKDPKLLGILEQSGFTWNRFGEIVIIVLIIAALVGLIFGLYRYFTSRTAEPQEEAEQTGDAEAQPLNEGEAKLAEAEAPAEQTSA